MALAAAPKQMPPERFFVRWKFVKSELLRTDRREIPPLREPTRSRRREHEEKASARSGRNDRLWFSLGCDGGAGAAGGAIDGFDQSDAFAAFGAVADWFAICADSMEEIFEDFLVAANVGDGGG